MKKLLDILNYITYITLFSEVLPFIFFLFFFKRIKYEDRRGVFLFTLITAFLLLLLVIFRYIHPSRAIYFSIVRIHNVIEFSLIGFIYSYFIKSKVVKKIIAVAIILFFILCLYDYISSKVPSLAFIPLLTESLFFILLNIYFFFEKIKQEANESLFNTFMFWFAVAFLINFSGNFLLFVYSETSKKDPDFNTNYTIIYSTVTILKNLLLCLAITMKEYPNKNITTNDTFLPNKIPLMFTPDKTSSI